MASGVGGAPLPEASVATVPVGSSCVVTFHWAIEKPAGAETTAEIDVFAETGVWSAGETLKIVGAPCPVVVGRGAGSGIVQIVLTVLLTWRAPPWIAVAVIASAPALVPV